MDCRKGFRILFRGLFVALALSIAAGFTFFSSTIPIHAATTYSWPLIGPGSTGADVYSVQLMLQAHGYSLSIDGVDGPQTTGAVISFQSAHGLSADGVVGPLTWPVLVVTTRDGSTGSAVVALQRQLNAHGASLTVDGDFGPATQSAVESFQNSHGIGVDGIAGPQTWNALVGSTASQAYSWPVVGQGASGADVYSIQLMLQAHGYSLGIDGSFGPQTASTVKAFQSAHGLSVDGIVGSQTWPALVITTRNGSTGSAVVALQRQLNAHGASLTVDGDFGPATQSAVESFQSSHGIGVDGIAGPQTWSALVSIPSSPPPPPPPPPPPGEVLWGVDTVSPITSSFLSQVSYDLGTPQFVGRYLDYSPRLSTSEAGYIHSRGIHILPIYSDLGGDTGYSTGVSRADAAISEAHALGIPKGTIIIADIESRSSIDASYVQGWYNAISGAGYTAGYYENPYPGSSEFDGAFCGAISGDSAVANSILYSSEPEPGGITTEADAPAFGPSGLLCSGVDRGGHTRIWQYGEQGSSSINVDTDEMESSVPLW